MLQTIYSTSRLSCLSKSVTPKIFQLRIIEKLLITNISCQLFKFEVGYNETKIIGLPYNFMIFIHVRVFISL